MYLFDSPSRVHIKITFFVLLDPLLLIIYHTGCAVIEQIVLHLTQFFRLNGINAVSELTAEDQIHKHGRGVYLNEMLRQADFVLVLCTEGKCTANLLRYLFIVHFLP